MIYYELLEDIVIKIYGLRGKIELIGIYDGLASDIDKQIRELGGVFYDLNFGFCIIEISAAEARNLGKVTNIIYVELAQILSLNDEKANNQTCIPQVQENYNLDGEGILVGFVDSGIDYTHPAFIDENGETRIEAIFDVSTNEVWNKDEINEALKSTNPLSVVNEQDVIGHGTAVAGVACGGGKIDRRYYGVAYKSRIAMSKVIGSSSQLLRGIKFLIDKASELKLPLVINLSFSTNNGAHDGTSLMELYINTLTILKKVTIVCAVGNEGDKSHHYGTFTDKSVTFKLNVGENQNRIVLQIVKNPLADVILKIRNPRYQIASNSVISRQVIAGSIGSDNYFAVPNYPKPFSLSSAVILSIEASSEKSFISSGEWEITLDSLNQNINEFNVWISTSENLNPETVFLNPVLDNTYGMPSTVFGVISVGSYNYNNMGISPFSGRGTVQNMKPDIVAPGENVMCPTPGGGFSLNSGTSISTPIVSGSCALLMQWGIVKQNDPFLYGNNIKYYMIKSANRLNNEKYPNTRWGFGALCLKQVLDLASGVTGQRKLQEKDNKIYININEKFRQTCFSIDLKETGDKMIINLNVECKDDVNLYINCIKPDLISVGVKTPGGNKIDKIEAVKGTNEVINFANEGSKIQIIYKLPEAHLGNEIVELKIKNPSLGVWSITIFGDFIFKGEIKCNLKKAIF